MKKQLSSVKWIGRFFAWALLLVLLLTLIAYAVDPFLQFRARDNCYELCVHAATGLIRNYDYDFLIVGSSMTQNFDMDVVRRELGVKPLHVGLGGMKSSELLDLMQVAYEAGAADSFLVSADLYRFTDEVPGRVLPDYLFRTDPLSRLHYLLSYQVWFHYLPMDLALVTLNRAGISPPAGLHVNTSIDRYQYWGDRDKFGEDVVLRNYRSGAYAVSAVDTEDLYNRMKRNIDAFLGGFDYSAGEHIFFFPPYSCLYWANAQNEGYCEEYLRAKAYFVQRAAEYGAVVYDFQSADCTTDLNNYKDTTHYCPAINDWIIACIAKGEYLATADSIGPSRERLLENTSRFREQYAELFE